MRRNPVAKLDPDTCIDFSTQGNLVTDKYREGWEKIFGKEVKKKKVKRGRVPPVSRSSR